MKNKKSLELRIRKKKVLDLTCTFLAIQNQTKTLCCTNKLFSISSADIFEPNHEAVLRVVSIFCEFPVPIIRTANCSELK